MRHLVHHRTLSKILVHYVVILYHLAVSQREMNQYWYTGIIADTSSIAKYRY